MHSAEHLDKAFLKHLGQHLVAMCGSYVAINDKGEPTGPTSFYSYTGTVIQIHDKWCILTAGHCLEKLEAASKNTTIRIECQVLADYFGPNVTNTHSIPFQPLEQGILYVDQDGLDFGLVIVNTLLKMNLARNGIVPFTSQQWHFPAEKVFDSYAIIGFPDEYTEVASPSGATSMSGNIKPTYVPLQRLADDTQHAYPQFKAEIVDMGSQQSIVGMSGGPILGIFREACETKYLLVALQSRWNEIDTVLGCLIPNVMACVQEKLNEYAAQSQSPDLAEPSTDAGS